MRPALKASAIRLSALMLSLLVFSFHAWASSSSLADAISANQADEVEELLATARAEEVRPSLLLAVTEGVDETIVRLLIDRGADVSAQNESGLTPLTLAIAPPRLAAISSEVVIPLSARRRRIVDMLLDAGADINAKTAGGETVVNALALRGEVLLVEKALERGGGVNAAGADGRTPLHVAADANQIHCMKKLLERGADPNARDLQGATPLYLAARRGHYDAVRLLLEFPAQINMPDNGGTTPLLAASQKGFASIVTLLKKKGANINSRNAAGESAMSLAVKGDDSELKAAVMGAAYLLLREITVRGRIEDIERHLAESPSLEFRDTERNTPLIVAAKRGLTDAVILLLNRGADPSAANSSGRTALIYAVERRDLRMVKALVRKGASTGASDIQGRTPISIARGLGYDDILHMLIETDRLAPLAGAEKTAQPSF